MNGPGDLLGELRPLLEGWRSDAQLLRRRGAPSQADALESAADELAEKLEDLELERLTLEEAKELSGYSYSHLQHLVADGTIPNAGSAGSPRILRRDVPLKPGHGQQEAPSSASKTEALDAALGKH